ncbi:MULTISPECIES: hypothetical protein [unclassified Micromonospora]|uniref:hypothetical protein n=1 Tax=unclassified Micromonospora TaxID=2617518 RepID=UPI0022C9DC77|nr:hypothetical protein [Micromonospora sp. AKA38]GHJ12867.1 hypothetical protein TPA0908_08620 [Micromonospora sp. AKA38]
MRRGPLLLTGAAVCAVLHAVGVLAAHPVWRGAEVLSLALLLAYALTRGLPAPRWSVPAALAVLLVDAVRTMPAAPGGREFGWTVYGRIEHVDVTAGFAAGLTACGAALAATVLLLVGWRARVTRGPVVTAALVAVPLLGYALIRVVDLRRDLLAEQRSRPGGPDVADAVGALILAVLPALALALTALALAVLLVGRGRWLAAAGAVLLSLVAWPLIDTSIDAVRLPVPTFTESEVLYAVTPTAALPQPVPALAVLVELTAYLLLVAGLAGAGRRAPAAPAPVAGPG